MSSNAHPSTGEIVRVRSRRGVVEEVTPPPNPGGQTRIRLSGFEDDPEGRASLPAKCILVDDRIAFVTSADFTEWVHRRNVEAGVFLRSPHVAAQLREQFDPLVTGGQVHGLGGGRAKVRGRRVCGFVEFC
jgi:phosphatidylserine/phosphatidylglycerophosphate/cardiolipin synthase-like enzyme